MPDEAVFLTSFLYFSQRRCRQLRGVSRRKCLKRGSMLSSKYLQQCRWAKDKFCAALSKQIRKTLVAHMRQKRHRKTDTDTLLKELCGLDRLEAVCEPINRTQTSLQDIWRKCSHPTGCKTSVTIWRLSVENLTSKWMSRKMHLGKCTLAKELALRAWCLKCRNTEMKIFTNAFNVQFHAQSRIFIVILATHRIQDAAESRRFIFPKQLEASGSFGNFVQHIVQASAIKIGPLA